MIVNQLEKPYSDCTIESDQPFFKKFKSLNYRYNRMDCRDLCKQKRIEDQCKCYFPRLLVISRNNSCVTPDEFKCVDMQFAAANLDEFNNDCNELCPLECNKMILSTVYSQTTSNTNELRDTVEFSIFYDSLSLIEVTEYPSFGLVDFISNIGGTFGLFLGMSVLSFLELVEIFFEMIVFLLFKK